MDDVDPNKFFTFFAMPHGHATRQAASITGTKALLSLGLSKTQCKLELPGWLADPESLKNLKNPENGVSVPENLKSPENRPKNYRGPWTSENITLTKRSNWYYPLK